MTDDQNKPHTETSSNPLFDELNALGKTFEQTVRSMLNDERAQSMRRDLSTGMQQMFEQAQQVTQQAQQAAQQAQEDPRVQDLTSKGQQTIENIQNSPAVKDLQDALVRGLRYVNEQLQEVSQRAAEGYDPNKPQEVHIDFDDDDDTPATGPTVRLDEDDKPQQ